MKDRNNKVNYSVKDLSPMRFNLKLLRSFDNQ